MHVVQAHSEDMAANRFLGHTGSDGSEPWDRARAAGYASSMVAENAHRTPQTVQKAFDDW